MISTLTQRARYCNLHNRTRFSAGAGREVKRCHWHRLKITHEKNCADVHSSNTHTYTPAKACKHTQAREHPQLSLTMRKVHSFQHCDFTAVIQVQLHIADYWKIHSWWSDSLTYYGSLKQSFVLFYFFFALKSGIQIIIIRQTRLPKITLQLASLTQAHLYLGVILSPTGHRTGPCWTHSGAEYGYQACLCTLSSPPDMDRAIPRSARQATWTSAAGANCIRGQQQRQAGLTGTPATA